MPDLQYNEYYQNFTIKTALNTVYNYDDVKRTIRQICIYATKLVQFGSIFINFLVLYGEEQYTHPAFWPELPLKYQFIVPCRMDWSVQQHGVNKSRFLYGQNLRYLHTLTHF